MSALPTKRILVYVAIGIVVLVVGVVGIASAGGTREDEAVVIDAALGEATAAGYEGAGGLTAVSEGAVPEVTTTEAPRIWVQVTGAVTLPGVYQLYAGSRVFEAVAAAGGFSSEADQQAIALAAQLSDGCRVYVPKVGESVPGGVVGPAESSAGVTGGVSTGVSTGGPVSLNSATAVELDSLPGIGPSLAQQIIAYRADQGPFTSVEQLTEVPGIGPAKMEQLRPLVVL